jgi:hypothetical protein
MPDPGLGAWTIDITFDPALVTLADCVPQQGGVCNPDFDSDTVRITGASANGLDGDAVLGSLTFLCDVEGTSDLSISISTLADATVGDPQPIDAAVSPGEIACQEPVPTATPRATSTPIIVVDGVPDRDCSEFAFQEDAQAVYNANPGDPFDLDEDGDAVACETLPRRGVSPGGKGPSSVVTAGGGSFDATDLSPQVLLIAGLVGAGIAWLIAGLAGLRAAEARSSFAPRLSPRNGPFGRRRR